MSLPVPVDPADLPDAAWGILIWSPSGTFLGYFEETSSPNPIRGHIEAVVGPCGRTESIRFDCVQTIAQIQPRQIIQFTEAMGLVAAGVVVTSPPTISPGAGPADQDQAALERVACVGLELLVQESIVGPMVIEVDTDVSDVAYQLCQAYAHPALIIHPMWFPPSGMVIGTYYKPYATLAECLDELVRALPHGGCWRVNQTLNIEFTPNPEPEEPEE